jgi:CHAT domain-containing protein
MLLQQGRPAEAEALFRQAVAMLPTQGSMLARANLLNGLGMALSAQDQFQAAYDAQRLALDALLGTLPADHPRVAAAFATIGETLLRAGQPEIARQSLERAVTLQQAAGDTLRAGRALQSLAAAMALLNDPQTAQSMANDGRAMMASVLPQGHPDLIRAAFNQSWLALGAGDAATALPLARATLAEYAALVSQVGADATIASAREPDMRRQVLAVTAAAWASDPADPELLDAAFQAAQWAGHSQAARATQRMSARFAAGSDALAALARRKQDLVNLWAARDAEYLAALGQPGANPLRETAGLERDIAALDADLVARFPAYAALVSPKVLSVAQVQGLLGPAEALVLAVATEDETYVFAISPDSAGWTRANLTRAQLDDAVRILRADLDPNAPARAAASLDDSPAPKGKPFDRSRAFALYTQLFAPLAPQISGVQTLLAVLDGPLSSLPLQVLVTMAPKGDDGDPQALRDTAWFVKSHGFATLPAVANLADLRREDQRQSLESTAFAGFGAPALTGIAATPEPLARFYDGAAARLDAVRALAPLPGTKRELLGLAAALGAPQDAVHLGIDATEAALRRAPDLGRARVLALATHGLIAGDITGLSEPALVFTPPEHGDDPGNDGLLTASEAAQLTLNADWVILSACNTAAADGTPGAAGLSGLASGFLYAGARAVLVSHWPVRDDAAALLTTGAVMAQTGAGLDRALALRASTLALMADTTNDGFAHPSAWGPFVLVGDLGG